MIEFMRHFDNVSGFGMDYLMIVPDQSFMFVILMSAMMLILSVRDGHSASAWESADSDI